MKLKLTLLLLLLPLLAFAKHAEFLGIPINGNITQFTTKLNNKGFTVNWKYSKISGDARWFNGSYYDRKCQLIAYYTPGTKLVYRVKVIYTLNSESSAERLMDDLKDALSSKYDIAFEEDDFEGYKSWNGNIYDKELSIFNGKEIYLTLGWVNLYMRYGYWDYVLQVDFFDRENYGKYQEIINNNI